VTAPDLEVEQLRHALTRYLCGGERSHEDVRRLEGFLPSRLIEMPIFEDLATDLALYAPSEGPDYVDDVALQKEIRWVLEQLGVDVHDC
jgi:hypothetical protein